MKSVFSRFLISGFVAVNLVSCAPPLSNSPNKQRELEDRQELISAYSEIAGTYRGLVENRPDGSDPFEIEVKLFLVEEQNGLNEDGEAKFRPALRARYRRLDFPMDGIGERTLIVRYYRETGELAASTSAGAAAGSVMDSGYLSVTGTLLIAESSVKVELRDHRGFMGVAVLKKLAH